MRHSCVIILGLLLFFIAPSCDNRSDEPTEFDIVGKWGVTTVTYINPDGTSNFFGRQSNSFYSYWTFQINGVLIIKSQPSGDTQYADYVYDVNKKNLNYLYEGQTRRINAFVSVYSPTSMTVTADLQEVGKTIYTMEKVAW